MLRICLVSGAIFTLSVFLLHADHLAGDMQARGPAERWLAGIHAGSRKYHRPAQLNPHAVLSATHPYEGCTAGVCGGEEEVTWTEGGCKVTVSADYDAPDAVRLVMGVDVAAVGGGDGAKCKTGRGLALGDTLARAVILYGPRFFVNKLDLPKGGDLTTGVLFQWHDETELQVTTMGDQKIVALSLGLSEE